VITNQYLFENLPCNRYRLTEENSKIHAFSSYKDKPFHSIDLLLDIEIKLIINNYRKYLKTSPYICRWVPMYNSMHLYPKKTFILMTFWSSSDAASILKNPRIDAVSESEIVIKLIENYFLKKVFFY
jgi:hypothetical protein